jgi:hypothetical protein
VKAAKIGGFREEIQNNTSPSFRRVSHMNHSGFLRFTASLVMALLLASNGLAQQTSATAVNATPVPHLVSYSGILKDGSGKPVTGNCHNS